MTSKKKNILAIASYTLKVINDGAQGPQGPQGPPGENKDFYDAMFVSGKEFWSSNDSSYDEHDGSVTIEKEQTSKYGGNVFQASGTTHAYAKNKIPVEAEKIYRFTFRVRQIQDPLNGSNNSKVHAGALCFNANGDNLTSSDNKYFVVTNHNITVSNDWKEFVGYISTKARDEIVNAKGKTLCPAVKAFENGTLSIKPTFAVNTLDGNGIAQVDCLLIEDYTQEWNALYELRNKLDSDSQSVFDALTNGGKIQGIYMQDGQLYINGQYINAKNLRVLDINENLTLGIDENGYVTINAVELNIGSKPVASKEDVSTSIDNISVGGRNLTPNTGFLNGSMEGWEEKDSHDKMLSIGRFSDSSKSIQVILNNATNAGIQAPPTDCIPNTNYILSYWVYVSEGCRVGQLLQFVNNEDRGEVLSVEYTNVSSNTWTHITQKFNTNEDIDSVICTPVAESNSGSNVIFKVTEFKIEEGTKTTTWTPAPEDLDNAKVDVGGSINDVNNSNGQIQYPKLNIKGMIRFTDFDEGLAKHYIVKRNQEGEIIETTINGGSLETGSVKADKITMYNLSVVRRKQRPHDDEIDAGCEFEGQDHIHWQELDTSFNINEEGHVRASGTFSSFNFNELLQDEGWQINEEGDSVFNNTIIRGRVELPNAGVTDHGGGDGKQLLTNADFNRTSQVSEEVQWDKSLNGNLSVDDWVCYNNEVENPTQGYHPHVDINTFGYNVISFINKNSTIEQENRPMEIYQTILSSNYKFKANTSYSVSFEVYSDTANMQVSCGLKYNIADNETKDFHSDKFSYLIDSEDVSRNKWRRLTYTFKTHENMDIEKEPSIHIFGHGEEEGILYVRYVKLEEGTKAHNWSPETSLVPFQTRIWAGESYTNRDKAPFRVLHNGTVIATRGEFGGTFTGRVEIGNIKIYDTNTTTGTIEIRNNSDENVIVKVSETDSYFSSRLSIGTLGNDKRLIPHFDFSPNNKKLELLNGAIIDVGSATNKKLSLINNETKGAFAKFGDKAIMNGEGSSINIFAEDESKVRVNVGNFKEDGSSTVEANLSVDGNIDTNSITIGNVKIIKSSDGNGIDFYVD